MQARRTGRELALLGLSQLSEAPKQLVSQNLDQLLLAAVKTLATEARDDLEAASDELKRGSSRLFDTDLLAADLESSKLMVEDAINLTQAAINRLAQALELPQFIQLGQQAEVRDFALQLLEQAVLHQATVDTILGEAMVAWQLKRLARIDRDILRLAVIEMDYLGTPDRVAINEAVELAKRYSDDDGYRFINGVLRRVITRRQTPSVDPSPEPWESAVNP
ncbi:MAG: transcription antitermination factor NusB [Cyanobacteria bacterium REEB459]|nr:transcription antitermination factor NusB [Cyanobacteria bacterium REEB459]